MQLSMDDLTFENIGIWPTPIKVAVVMFGVIMLLVGSYSFYFKERFQHYDSVRNQEHQLRLNFESLQRQAANLEAYKEQVVQMKELFQKLLRQLPSKNEVPGLLEDISKIGVAYGLNFQLFDPMSEVVHDFYTELPIRIEVEGDYHALAHFVSDLASLPRIVTVHSISIESVTKEDSGKTILKMQMVAKTYHYVEGATNA